MASSTVVVETNNGRTIDADRTSPTLLICYDPILGIWQTVKSDLGKVSTTNYVWDPAGLAWVKMTQPAGGGGGPATIADGADVAEGATTNAAVITDVAGTVSGKLRGLVKWAFERMPAALGQTTMLASLPVAIASNQSSIPVTLASTTVTGTVTANIGTAGTLALDATLTGGNQVGIVKSGAKGTSVAALVTSNPVDANTSALHVDGSKVTQPVSIAAAILSKASDLVVSTTAAANTALTLTLPAAAAGLFHYITHIEITRTATAALAGTATLVITTTNLPGALALSVGNAMAAGGTQKDFDQIFPSPLKSSVAATATTIVAPAPGLGVLWRMNVFYYTGT